MRASVLAAVAAAAMLTLASPRASVAGQVDFHLRRTPEPTPKVIIEEPRPPNVTIETEGRAGDLDCRSTIAADRHDQARVTDPGPVCDPE